MPVEVAAGISDVRGDAVVVGSRQEREVEKGRTAEEGRVREERRQRAQIMIDVGWKKGKGGNLVRFADFFWSSSLYGVRIRALMKSVSSRRKRI